MNYRLSDLRNFVASCEHRTISEAALVIGISQPALSESIKRLERDLSLILMFRTRSGISLSPEGRRLVKKARSILVGLEQITSLENDVDTNPNPIRIGAHSIIAQWIVPKVMQHLQKSNVHFSFEMVHGLSRNVQSQIQKGELDIGIVVNPLAAPGLVSKKIATDNVSVWSSTKDKHLNFLFCDLSLIQTQDILRRWSKRPDMKIVHSTSLEFVAEMVRSASGMGILPDKALVPKPSHLQKAEKAPFYRDLIHLLYRPEFGRTQYERSFLDAIYAASSMES